MIFKQVAGLKRLYRATRGKRTKRVLHPALVFRIAMWVLMIPQAVVAQESMAPNAPLVARLDTATAQQTEALLASLFRTQDAEGAYVSGDEDDDRAILFVRPLFATMALDAFSTTRNTASLAQAANSISRYYGNLFSSADRDGDRLIETTSNVQGREIRMEDPAFNALLALDLRNLARIDLELRRPMQALYWYDSARSVERAVVAGTFDPDDNYCFPHDASGAPVRRFDPAAALPARFSMVVGENHAEYMRTHVIDWASQATANVDPADRALNAVGFMAAVDVLGTGDHRSVIDGLRKLMPLPSAVAMPVERYALARARVDIPLSDDDIVFGLFLCLERAGEFSDPERFRIERALPDVRALSMSPTPPVLPIDGAATSIDATYTTVATLGQRLRTTSYFSPDEAKTFPGADANMASRRLLDDVTLMLHRAENRLFEMRYAAQGVRAQVILVEDRVVTQSEFAVRWEVSSKAPVTWKSISAGVFGEAISPLNGIALGASPSAPLRFSTRYTARGSTGTLRFTTFTAVFEDANGTVSRVHFDRTIYLNPPVSVIARFPQGRTIRASSIPLYLAVQRHSNLSADAKYYWFSASGLRLAEGNTGFIHFAAQDTAAVTLNVEVPTPCRPGVFPFTLKFFSGDRDAGTITSSLFKPYQWTYVGPFPADDGLARTYPPEQGVNLLQSYPGPNGSVRWRTVPEAACDPRGGISLRTLAGDHGVHYLYTIVSCAYETQLHARLFSNTPAALFVNGRRVASVASDDSAVADIHLAPDKNHVLIKVLGDADARVSFSLGNDDNLATDEFDNNLAELAGGYREISAREMATSAAPTQSRRLVTLRFQDDAAGAVAVVGTFNGWSPANSPMQKNGGVWELTLSLLPGKYSYRFLVDHKTQVLDPSAATTEPDGYGGKNSVLVVKQ